MSLPSRGAWIEIYCQRVFGRLGAQVAPLAGSVDRNVKMDELVPLARVSLPSRGAWIEIPIRPSQVSHILVAPLAGSVDRNAGLHLARDGFQRVAPLAGSVDRNTIMSGWRA